MPDNEEKAPETPATDDQRLDQIPRFRQVTFERREAIKRAEAAEARLAELQPKLAERDALEKQIEQLKVDYSAKEARWQTKFDAVSIGFDSEALEIAELLHSKMPAENRPALLDTLKAWKAEPSKAPRAMQMYIGVPPADQLKAEPPPKVEPPKVDPAKQRPNLNAGAAPGTAAGGGADSSGYTAAQINAAVADAQKSGDWSAVQEMLPRVQRQLQTRGS